jgi:hypothetical protein
MSKISALTQNQIYNSLFEIMGTTGTGYGATLISDPVQAGDLIKANNWDRMIMDVERCLIHQTGTSTNDITVANTSTIARFSTPARMYTQIQYLQKNVGQVDPSQVETFTHNTRRLSSDTWTVTNTSSVVSMMAGQGYMTAVNWSWFYPNQLNYFFNLGGKMKPEIKVRSGRIQDKAAWAPLIAAANDVKFGLAEFNQAMSNPDKEFIFVVSGSGDWNGKPPGLRALGTPWVKHITPIKTTNYQDTDLYAANALTVTFKVVGNTVIGTLNFLVGLGYKNKGKYHKTGKNIFKKYNQKYNKKYNKKYNILKGVYVQDVFTRQIVGKYIAVQLKLETDFVTTYPNGSNGGIAAQLPQTQIIANSLSAYPAPVPQFTMGVGETSEVETVTLRNNSKSTCIVDSITLTGYTTGTVTPNSFSIEPFRSQDIQIQYTGDHAGHHRGYLNVNNNINSLVLFTEVNVGSTNPPSVDVTTSTYDIISQDFVVDHAGGYFKDFSVAIQPAAGFSLVNDVPGTTDTFNITFNGKHFYNGNYSTVATVTVNPLDSSQQPTVWTVPFVVRMNVNNRHIADWRSCTLGDNTQLGISYDIIDGRTYITAAIGSSTSNIVELRSDELAFNSWTEVYRMLIEPNTTRVYSKDNCIKSETEFKYGSYFGVGTAEGSLLTINHDKGNVEILMNTLYTVPQSRISETLDLSTAFRYHDNSRRHQLQENSALIEGGQCYVFMGFERDGRTQLSLVIPN